MEISAQLDAVANCWKVQATTLVEVMELGQINVDLTLQDKIVEFLRYFRGLLQSDVFDTFILFNLKATA